MSDIAKLGFSIDTQGLVKGERALDSFAKTGRKTEKSIDKSSSGVSTSFGSIAKSIAVVTSSLVTLNKLVAVTREFDVLNSQLITATGSAENAAKAFSGIQDFAARTPFDLAQVTNSFVKLVNLGLTPSEKAIESYGNTASAMGKDLNQLIEAVADATTNEFERLKEFGIKTKQEGENVSFTFRGVSTTVKKEAAAIEGFLMALGENEFAGAMAQRVNTLDGAISNLGDNWDKLFLNISQAGIGSLIEDQVRDAIDVLDELNLFIESGQLEASIALMSSKFVVFGDDIEAMLDSTTDSFITNAGFWNDVVDRFIELSKSSLFEFPENMRASIQLAAVELAHLVEIGDSTFTAFGKVLGTKLAEIDQKLLAFAKSAAQALNPFSDGSFDLEAELQRLSDLATNTTNEILANAEASAERNTQLRRDSIIGIMDERTAALDSSNAQIDSIAKMGEAFKKAREERKKLTGDSLAGFKIVAKETEKSNKLTSKQQKDFAKLTKDVENFGGEWTKTGSVIVDAFGDIADSMNDYMKQLKAVENQESDLAKLRIKHGDDNADVIRLQKDIESNRISAELSGIKSLSKAGQSLFDEKTAAAKAFAALNKIIAVAEIAMSFQKMAAGTTEAGVHVVNETTKQGANALTAITSAFAAPFPVGFVAGAAMIGIMAALIGNVASGGSAPDLTESRQDNQGTGSLLGSVDKSQSILESQDRFEDLQIDQLSELRGIRGSLNAVADGITLFTRDLIASGDLGQFGGTGSMQSGTGSIRGELTRSIGLLDIDGIAGKLVNSLFGSTKKKLTDSGIKFVAQSLSDILDGGIIEASQFFDIATTKKKLFGLIKRESSNTEFQSLDDSFGSAIGSIFKNIGETVLQSAELLGFETVSVIKSSFDPSELLRDDDFRGAIRGGFGVVFSEVEVGLEEALGMFKVDLGQISLEGLSGEEVEAELQAVFSKQADLIAEFLVPSIAEYQKVGEGLFDTLTRVTQEQVIFNDNIEKMGFDLAGLSSIIQIEVAQSIIGLVGGLENFADLSTSFFENFFTEAEQFAALENSLTETFDSLGLSLVHSEQEFRDLVDGIDLSTESGQELFAALLELNPAMSEFIEGIEDAEKAIRGLAVDAFSMLEKSIALEKQRITAILDVAKVARDSELLRLSDLRTSLEAEKSVRDQALLNSESALIKSFNFANQTIELEKQRARLSLDASRISLSAELDRIRGLRAALSDEKTLRESSLSFAKAAINKSFNAEMERIKNRARDEVALIQDNATARIQSLNDEKSAIDSLAGSMRSLISTISSSIFLSIDLMTALTSARSGDFSKAQSLDIEALSTLDSSRFSSAEDLAVQQAINQNRLKEISDLASKQLTESETLLSVIESQINSSKINSDVQILAIQNESNKQVESLTNQLNTLLGIDTNILSINDSINKLKESQQSINSLNHEQEQQKLDDLIVSANKLFEISQQGYANEIERLDSVLSSNNNQLNTLLDIDTSILSTDEAIKQFKESQQKLDSLNYEKELSKLDMLVTSADDVFALHELAYQDELTALNSILVDNEKLLNAALGIDTSILSVVDAISELSSAIQNIPAPIVDIPPPIVTVPPPLQTPIGENELLAAVQELLAVNKLVAKNTNTTARFSKAGVLFNEGTSTL